jgi:hypothetical protein
MSVEGESFGNAEQIGVDWSISLWQTLSPRSLVLNW